MVWCKVHFWLVGYSKIMGNLGVPPRAQKVTDIGFFSPKSKVTVFRSYRQILNLVSLFLDGQYFLRFVLDGFESLISFSSHACAAADGDALPR
jgi:hypothetical protein